MPSGMIESFRYVADIDPRCGRYGNAARGAALARAIGGCPHENPGLILCVVLEIGEGGAAAMVLLVHEHRGVQAHLERDH